MSSSARPLTFGSPASRGAWGGAPSPRHGPFTHTAFMARKDRFLAVGAGHLAGPGFDETIGKGRPVCQEQHGIHQCKDMVYTYSLAIVRLMSCPVAVSYSAIL